MPSICIVKHNTVIQLHPAARDAFEWSQCFPRLIANHKSPLGFSAALSRLDLHCVMQQKNSNNKRSKNREFFFYSPIWATTFWLNGQPPSGTRLIYTTGNTTPTDEQIEFEAWGSALLPLFLSVQPTRIALLRDSLQAMMPTSVAQSLFDKSKISDTELCHWTGLSRAALIKQRTNHSASHREELVDLVGLLSASVDD